MIRPYTKVLVPPYSDEELNACLGFYTSRGLLARGRTPWLTERALALALKRGFSGMNQKRILKYPREETVKLFLKSWVL